MLGSTRTAGPTQPREAWRRSSSPKAAKAAQEAETGGHATFMPTGQLCIPTRMHSLFVWQVAGSSLGRPRLPASQPWRTHLDPEGAARRQPQDLASARPRRGRLDGSHGREPVVAWVAHMKSPRRGRLSVSPVRCRGCRRHLSRPLRGLCYLVDMAPRARARGYRPDALWAAETTTEETTSGEGSLSAAPRFRPARPRVLGCQLLLTG